MGKLTKVQEVAIAMVAMGAMADQVPSLRQAFGKVKTGYNSRRSPEKRRKQRKASKAGRKAARQ